MAPRRGLVPPIAQLALLLAAGVGALEVHKVVASETLSDQVNLLITGSTALLLALASVVAARIALAKVKRRERAALAVLPVGLLLVWGGFVAASVIDTSVEMEALVQADEPITPPAAVVLGPGGRDVRLSGEMQEGVARRLATLLDAHPEVTRIHLTSEGGLADEGQAIGDVIAAHRLTTFVPDYCVSACTLAFVRGRERFVLDDARVGFHAPYEEGLFGALYQGDSSDQRAAYVAAGVAPDFVDAALKVDPAGLWYPTIAQLLAAHVVTASVGHDRFPDSNLDGAATLEGARALVLHNFPVMKAFLQRQPDAVGAIARWYLDAYRRARSEGENANGLRIIVHSAVATALADADDSTLVDVAHFLARALAVSDSSRACRAIGGSADVTVAAEQLEPTDTHAEQAAINLLGNSLNGAHRLEQGGLVQGGLVQGGLVQGGLVQGGLAHGGPPAPGGGGAALNDVGARPEPTETCLGWRQSFAALLRHRDVAATMRALVEAEAQRSLLALETVPKQRS